MRCQNLVALSIVFFCSLSCTPAVHAQPKPNLTGGSLLTNGWFRFWIPDPGEWGYEIQRSTNLLEWTRVGILLGTYDYTNSLPFTDAGGGETEFYRVRAFQPGIANDWKNQVFYPGEPFLSQPVTFGEPEVRWVKFAIKMSEPSRVYYQDSTKYKFHYDFARARLPEFAAMTPSQFDAVSLHRDGQQIVLGTLLYAPNAAMSEVGVQFVGMDLYDPEQVAGWFELVRHTIVADESLQLLYMPTFEQRAALENRDWFQQRGIELAEVGRWGGGQEIYSFGWAVGELKFVPGVGIAQAYASGELQPDDILLTDSVPAEVPFVAGILSLNASTPNSHVAILARSYGVPFAWLSTADLKARAESLVGKTVGVSATRAWPGSVVEILDLSALEPALREEIAGLNDPPPIQITPKETFGAYMASLEDVDPSDIRYFGGKAANFGFLRRAIPENSPVAFAISFDLWDEFMDQIVFTGKTLREEIAGRLAQYTYPPNVGRLQAELAFIRDLIEDSTQFTAPQQEAIAQVLLGNFDPQRKIRFRSSTNVEDSESFTGAGLYDSYSGCLADDLDGDTTGPSICDPEENRERGVFRAIRKVYASFYNDNAVLERLRHSVNEQQVGMAILVHYSSPDPTEMANGVATVTFTKQPDFHSIDAELVTQKGAVSVTNPDNSALPEVVRVSKFFSSFAETRQWSTLVPFGANVLEWDHEYLAFVEMFSKVAKQFEGYYPAKSRYTLDFEYKKIVPGTLRVKQVRELPTPSGDETLPRYLINTPAEWCLFQGEAGDVFGNHRLKSRLMLSTRDLKLDLPNLDRSIFGPVTLTQLDGAELRTVSGLIPDLPQASHGIGEGFSGTEVWDSWVSPESGTRWKLTTAINSEGPATESPLVTLNDLFVTLGAEYSQPQPGYNNFLEFGLVTNDFAVIRPCTTTNANSIPVTRTVTVGTGTNLTISFFWPQPPTGAVAGYTAPLVAWKETLITGLTSEPILLRGYYSQTYRPGHHNFSEEFLFEPRLEEGIDPAILTELEAQDIRLIHVYWGGLDDFSRVSVIGADHKMRPLGGKEAR